MGTGVEFDAIRALLDEWGELATGIGDDAAILAAGSGEDIVVSTDACVEGVHFERAWISAGDVGVRAAAAALSDIAAMGARADAVLVSFIVPRDWTGGLRYVARGIGDVVGRANARIVGGNISSGERFSVTLTVIGRSAVPVRRSGAQVGDVLLATGSLGGPSTAIAAFRAGQSPDAWALERFRAPAPRLAEGQWLSSAGAHAMIDISDGILADAGHLARASHVDIVLDSARLPLGPDVTVDRALRSGEEYELLVAVPAGQARSICEQFDLHFGSPLTVVGDVIDAAAEGSVMVRGIEGEKTDPRIELPAGYDHFSA